MRIRLFFILAIIAAIAMLCMGCTTGVRQAGVAIDTAHSAVLADEKILTLYHQSIMENFAQIKAQHIAEMKRIIDDLGSKNKLTPEIMKQGIDRLQANLDIIEQRRLKFVQLFEMAKKNNIYAKEALVRANDLISHAKDNQDALDALLKDGIDQASEKITGGSK